MTSIGLTLYLFGVVLDDMRESFGASVTTMSLATALWHTVNAGVSAWLGPALARIPIRRVMLIGAGLMSLGLVMLSLTQALWQAALVFGGLVTVGSTLVGGLPSATLVTRWYVARRGAALGFAAAGTTGAGVLIAMPAALLVERFGWRIALALLGAAAGAIVLPALLALVIERPEDVGERPDGRRAAPREPLPMQGVEVPSREILADPRFWLLTLMFALLFSAGSVSLYFTIPFAAQLGLPLVAGAAILAARSIAAILGKIGLGTLSDTGGRKRVLAVVIGLQLAIWTVLVESPNATVFVIAGVANAFVAGAVLPIEQALYAATFGSAAFSKVIGFRAVAALPAQLVAPVVAGMVYDATGDYAMAFRAFLPVFVLAGIVLYFIRDPEPVR